MGACNDRLLQNVYETGFALDEATLYLDTHPKCPMAMQYCEPHMTKVTCFSAALSDKTKYRRIRL